MDDNEPLQSPVKVEAGIRAMQIKNGVSSREAPGRIRAVEVQEMEELNSPRATRTKSSTQSPIKAEKPSLSPDTMKEDNEEIVGGEVVVKLVPGHPPKLARTPTQKIVARPARLFHSYEDKTEESKSSFQVISGCIYSSKYIGSTEHAMECDCAEEWDSSSRVNLACGDDSDCINRATKMECFGDCGCGADCQNQRFQRQDYANVTVIKTEKKGYGLRTDADLHANDFIFEYVGEVINEGHFRRRMIQYDEEGIKHFYFMSLTKGEFVDATKKGNLGRFCNHSCNPNCYVDKWVVGDKLRMGIFAERKIKAGEELVFNYNVDRYGADPQPCYCDEPNCTGFIGGKTQTERATKLSNTTIEALGIDAGDGWDTAVAKRPRKKKVGEDDEEYVNNVQPKSLDEEGVTKVMATLNQCKEKWIAVKLLGRIQRCDDERVRNRVVKMHGYQILNSALALWKEDFNVVLQILDILNQFPMLTRNKIIDSKIESTVESLKDCGDERVESQSVALLKIWSTLEVAYRIPRKKREQQSATTSDKPDHFGRRESGREDRKGRSRSPSPPQSRSRSRSIDAPRGPAGPNGSRTNPPHRSSTFYAAPRPPYRPRPINALPPGWFTATSGGSTYYYSAAGQTTWTKPTMPAAQPPPPPRPVSTNQALEDIINEITNAKANTPKDKVSGSGTPLLSVREGKKDKKDGKEKWRSMSEEKQKKLYENTLSPHVKYVMGKFKNKLPKDDLKRFAKEISKKLVNSDYKNNRVEDPTHITSRKEKQVKQHVKEYFDKAAAKRRDHERKKAEQKEKNAAAAEPIPKVADPIAKKEEESDEELGVNLSDDEVEKEKQDPGTPITPLDQTTNGDGLKRKREDPGDPAGIEAEDEDATPNKRLRSETPPPPPPPPPPPSDGNGPAESTPFDLPMADIVTGIEYPDSEEVVYGAHRRDVMDEAMLLRESPTVDIDPAPPPPAFTLLGPFSNPVDNSDNTQSPSVFEASDMTPIESEGERVDQPEGSYAGMDLERVQRLQVHNGS